MRTQIRYKQTFVPFLLILIDFILKFQSHQKINHLFILRSFFYSKSNLFSSFPIDTLVVLFNMEEHINVEKLNPFCIFYSKEKKIIKRNQAKIETLFIGEVYCRLTVYRMHCIAPVEEEPMQTALRFRNTMPFNIKVSNADIGPRKDIVVCPGRMFAFEQWHLFITAMELHRIHRVNLVVIYIQSVDKTVHKLIKAYADEDWVQIRASLLMPSSVTTLDFKPNDEIQWNTQVVNFQECLYEFRETAKFIAFPDWDDLMVTVDFVPLPNVLDDLHNQMPEICSFVYARYIGAIETLETMSTNKHDYIDLWKRGVAFTKNDSLIQHVGKVLARPKMVTAIRFHDAVVQKNCMQKELPMNMAYMIHARNYYNLSLEATLHDAPRMILNFKKFLSKISKPNINDDDSNGLINMLPKKDSALEDFYNCLGYSGSQNMWGRIFQIVQESTNSKCYSYARCNIHRIKLSGRCINVKNRWKTEKVGRYSISILQSSTFVEKEFCVI